MNLFQGNCCYTRLDIFSCFVFCLYYFFSFLPSVLFQLYYFVLTILKQIQKEKEKRRGEGKEKKARTSKDVEVEVRQGKKK